jgi:hypothetical protein
MIMENQGISARQPRSPGRKQAFFHRRSGRPARFPRRFGALCAASPSCAGILLALVVSGVSETVGADERPPALVVIDTGVCPSQVMEKNAPLAAAFLSKNQSELNSEPKLAATFSKNLLEADGPIRDSHGHGTHICGILWRELEALRGSPEPALVMLRAGERNMAAETLTRALRRTRGLATEKLRPRVVLCAFNLYPEDCEPGEFEAFETALRQLMDEGVWVVAAAGNRGRDLDEAGPGERSLPAAADHANLIVVAAANERGLLTARSNFGRDTVWIAARGVRVESLWNEGRTKAVSGTSQAAAIVAARVFHQALEDPGADLPEIRKRIEAGANLHPSLLQTTRSQRFLPRAAANDP